MGQPIRADGPQGHLLTKKGTPTMGGLMILSGFFVSALLWGDLGNPYVWTVILVTFAFGAIGFYDDYLKVTRQTHAGFSGKARLGFEFAVAGLACLIIATVGEKSLSTALALPFLKDVLINLSWFFIPFGAFVIVAAGNAVT